MKFCVTFKDPDGVHDSLADEAKRLTSRIPGLDDQERKLIACAKMDHMKEFVLPWLAHGEYVTIEFDTETKTATVAK